MAEQELRIGIAGACTRGRCFFAANSFHNVVIPALCDTNEAELAKTSAELGARAFTDYERMLDEIKLDAVIIATPMHLHAEQTIAALERGVSVLCEVTAAVSLEECRAVVAAAKKSRGIYMMAENYTYLLKNMLIREMVRRGEFGAVYYAEGEYIHELKELIEITKWRRRWHVGVNGITYPTHSLGPILQWFGERDRVVSVSCAGSGHHYRDPRGKEYEMEDSCVMLGKMRSGGLVKLRLDILSPRPHSMTNYQLQGTDGAFESARGGPGERDKIWLRSRCKRQDDWRFLDEFKDEFTPAIWRENEAAALQAEHGGGDYLELLDFINAVRNHTPPPIGIHEAMDMTIPGIVSQQSIAEQSRWIDVPDSRDW